MKTDSPNQVASTSDDSLQRFAGIARLYGEGALRRFRRAHVAIIGIGGVGSWAAESLARSGIGEFTLVDLDDLCITNINRQIHALDQSVGQPKSRVMADRIVSINPTCRVHSKDCFFSERTIEDILHPEATPLDAVIDAIDVFGPKSLLLAGCRERSLPVFSCGAAGGRTDPSMIQTADLSLTYRDALLNQVRRKLRSDYGFPKGEKPKKSFGITAIFSPEQAVFPHPDGCVSIERPENLPPGLRCDAGYGSATHVTATFGLFAAAEVLKLLASGD
ncbi:MAG: tRNA threonylcarbamoyladenosine dehydratase [Akkermansiaceae bacterium]